MLKLSEVKHTKPTTGRETAPTKEAFKATHTGQRRHHEQQKEIREAARKHKKHHQLREH